MNIKESYIKYNKSEKDKDRHDRYRKTEKYRKKVERYRKSIKGKENRKKYENFRNKNNNYYRIRRTINSQIYQMITEQSSNKRGETILKYLSYTIQELKLHLESLWESWMSWENYGAYEKGKQKWNIDHIIPQSKLLYLSMEEENFQKCWNLKNLRPLEVLENVKKGNK